MSDKKTIRKKVKEILSRLSKPLYEDYSYKIGLRLYEDEIWKQADIIGITVSKQPEVDTYQIIRKAWETGKTIVVPKCIPNEKKLSFHIITEFSQLESVFYGLLEPIPEITKEVKPEQIDLLIVPGLAYTREGYRIGFGGGYYDRYLTSYTGNTVSLAFNEQIIPQFSVEEYDLPIAKIITPTEVIKTK
ncbi:5-formyltetrahydrofolate cyclo-ligase [Neobacillus mesonae]|uniref:5-formyltetrahydrofolate cyclo-ligase n=1 Tax=Neobacillus mesonae TaxID=1193713 RepID=UPI00204113CA|nr:5-formyltetrahydrofolate cyclo-ligase [Neobacillus mesonae]MCM3566614.1 5-formyltetrahydrofolate cyclo-ligase [Neobacillus mesonae]